MGKIIFSYLEDNGKIESYFEITIHPYKAHKLPDPDKVADMYNNNMLDITMSMDYELFKLTLSN